MINPCWTEIRTIAALDTPKELISNEFLNGKTIVHYNIPYAQQFGRGEVCEGETVESNKQIVHGNELLVSKLNPYKETILITEKNDTYLSVCSAEFVVLKTKAQYDLRFFFYVYKSKKVIDDICSKMSSVTRSHQRANPEDISKIWVTVPPLPTQKTIAAYLDKETARIDELISKKERQIELLQEKRQAIVTHAVTKGLDPKAKMVDSGVEWIGEIPEGWGVAPLYAGYSLKLGKMLDTKKTTGAFLVSYLRNIDVQWKEINVSDLPQMDIKIDDREKLRLQKGDLLVCEGGEIGRAAIWNDELDECYFQKALHCLRPRNKNFVSEYLYYCLYICAKEGVFSANSPTSTIEHLTGEKLRSFRFPLPPVAVQRKIADFLNRQEEQVIANVSIIKKSIFLLREYRSSLITAAVSGQIDVAEMEAAV